MWYASWIILIIGLLLFIAGIISIELTKNKQIPAWAWTIFILGVVLIIVGIIMYVYQEYAGSCGKESTRVTSLKESGPDVIVIKKDVIVGGVITGSPGQMEQMRSQPSQMGGERSPLSSLAP